MSGEIIGLKGVKIPDLQETTEVRDSDYMILVDEETGRTYKVKREHIKAQKTSELVDDVGFLRAIPGEYMTESEVKEFTDAEIAKIFLNVDGNYQELKLQNNDNTLVNKIDDTKGGFIGYFDNSGVEKSSIAFNNNNEIDLKTQGINLTSPIYIKDGVSTAEPNPSEYSRIVRATTDATKGSFKIQLGADGGGFEVVNGDWDSCLFGVDEENGVQISSIDGSSRLKIDGRLIEASGAALALKSYNTSPIYFTHDNNKGVDTFIASGANATLGSVTTRWGEVYVGNLSLDNNGFSKLTNGLIVQWGNVMCAKDSGHAGIEGFEMPIVFPISFPNKPLSISCVPGTNQYDSHKITRHGIRYDTLNNNGVSTYVYAESGGAWHVKMFYIAIGY